MAGLPVQCLRLRHVYRRGIEEVTALHDLDLHIAAGSSVAVVGPSGSGKSTLTSLLAGLQRPTAGQLLVGADDLAVLPERLLLRVRATQVGVVVQNPDRNLLPFLDAVDNIRFAQRGPRSYGRRGLPDPGDLLGELDLAALAGTPVQRLSGGERQRLALAVGMSGQPGLLLADEPTSQLDTANRDRVVALLQRIQALFGTTVLTVTHDREVAAGFDRCIGLHEGRLVQDST